MKRMSEVFELPVSDMDLAYLTSQAEDGSMTFAENKRCKHAAHAVNNVDALADALDKLLSMLEIEGRQDTEIFKECEKASNAYWGIK